MNSANDNLQDEFLKLLCGQRGPSTVYLVNGVKLQGVITAHDDATLLLRREGHEQLVYKHAISTIMPHGKLAIADSERPERAASDL